jgi:hypothetical protein
MPKKTFYTKEELAEQKNNKVEQKPVEKSDAQIIEEEVNKVQTDIIQKELKIDAVKKKVSATVKRGKPVKVVLTDDKGNKLKKDGTIDKRAETGMNNLKKSRVYQQILENKKLKEQHGKVAVLTPYVDSSESENEFETENIKLELEPELPATGVASGGVSKGTDDFIKKQEAEREKMLADQIKAMELENKKLKDSFHYNSHLNRMQSLATNVKLKF